MTLYNSSIDEGGAIQIGAVNLPASKRRNGKCRRHAAHPLIPALNWFSVAIIPAFV